MNIENAIDKLIQRIDSPPTNEISRLYQGIAWLNKSRIFRPVIIYSWAILSYCLYEIIIRRINQDEIKKWYKERYRRGDKRFKYFNSYEELMEFLEKDYNILEFLKDNKYIDETTFDNARKCLEIRNNAAHYYEGEIEFEKYDDLFYLVVQDINNKSSR